MIGLVLVTHGRLAEEFVSAMEHVVGKQERIATIAIGSSVRVVTADANFDAALPDACSLSPSTSSSSWHCSGPTPRCMPASSGPKASPPG